MRRIYVFQGELDTPDFEDPARPISRDRLIDLFREDLDGMIRYRVLGKHYFTHNNLGLEANLRFEEMPCIRFDLRKTGVDALIDYLGTVRRKLGTVTIFNPEGERFVLGEDGEMDEEELREHLWPPDLDMSIEI